MTTATDVRDTARAASAAGISVVPPAEDGTKRPLGQWAAYQAAAPSADQLDAWYAGDGRSGVGFVCGAVSGNLECLEFEDRETLSAFVAAADAVGLGELVNFVTGGYCEATPGGGYHWLYRCDEITGNTKLARRVDPGTGEIAVLIETRGEGGYVIVAPTNGKVHPTGGRYELVDGGVDTIRTISARARRELHQLARTFDQTPDLPPRAQPAATDGGDRPGDDYNARTDWPSVLEPHGWVRVYARGGTDYWRRPGKNLGTSATTNHAGSDLLWVFSTSTAFAAERSYDRFGAYAVLAHGGDLSAAGKALREQEIGRAHV